ncbi:MAG: hypothetical protein LAN18_02775 [Acidobacteriia bacterium]|nr:hypothetical protein [Terriglobia bacterium]
MSTAGRCESRKSLRVIEMPPKLEALLHEVRPRQNAGNSFVFQDEIVH